MIKFRTETSTLVLPEDVVAEMPHVSIVDGCAEISGRAEEDALRDLLDQVVCTAESGQAVIMCVGEDDTPFYFIISPGEMKEGRGRIVVYGEYATLRFADAHTARLFAAAAQRRGKKAERRGNEVTVRGVTPAEAQAILWEWSLRRGDAPTATVMDWK